MDLITEVCRRAGVPGLLAAALVLVTLPAGEHAAHAQIPGCAPPAQLGVVFVLDDSGSMAGSDPTNLRAAATGIGLQEMGAGRVATAVAFESDARPLFGPTALDAGNIPALATQVAGALASSGGTSFQQAFVAAKVQLDAMPASVDRKAVIFLSDGEPNDRYTADQAIAAAGIPIYTVGFGEGGQGELDAIAQRSGGAAANVANAQDVQGAMARAVALLSCRPVNQPENFDLAPGQSREIPFDVPANTPAFTALATWGSGKVSARLIRPNKSILGPGTLLPTESLTETPTNARATANGPAAGRWRVRVTADGTNVSTLNVSIDLLGSAQLDHPLNKRPAALGPGCETEVNIRGRVAWSPCFKAIPGGFSSAVPMRIAGIDFDPAPGKDVKVLTIGRLTTDGARMSVTTSGPLLPTGTLTLHDGKQELSLAGGQHLEFKGERADAMKIGGLPIAANGGFELDWTSSGASVKLAVGLGRDFATILPPVGIDEDGRRTPGGEPKTLKRGFGLETTLSTSNDKGLAVENLSASVDAGKVYGVLGLEQLFISYVAKDNLWKGGAQVVPFGGPLAKYGLPSIRGEIGLTVNPLGFGSIALTVSDINKPIGPFVFLQKLGGSVTRVPPPFTIKGEVGISLGPKVKVPALGEFNAIEADGSAEYSYPATLKSSSNLKVIGQTIGSGALEANFAEPSGSVNGDLSLSVLGNGFQGRLDGWFKSGDFQIAGDASIQVFGKGLSGGEAFLSSRGMGGCRRGFGPDFGWTLDFSKSLPGAMHAMFSSCDFGGLRFGAAPRQAGVATQRFTVARNTSGLLVRVRGQGGQPQVVLRGGGREFALPAAQGLVETPQLVAIRDEANNDLYLVLNAPAAGQWTIDPLPGSAPLQGGLGTARALKAPRLRATLRRLRGGRFALTYRTQHSPGQRVQFVERGANGLSRVIRRTASSKGRIVFKPRPGSPGVRSIEGTVDLNRSVREQKTVATFRVRSTVRPAKPRRLVLLRRGTDVVVSWRAIAGQAGYVVAARLRDGRRFEQTVSGSRRGIVLRGVRAGTRVDATVRSFTRSGIHSQAARRTLRSGRRR